jgi:hypothetical protein
MRRGPGAPARSFTLIEVVAALAVASIIFLALGNTIYIATKAIPAKDDPVVTSVQAAQVLDQVAGELETAVGVTDVTSRSIAFTVADRDGDGNAERLAYSWSGNAGDPLVRTYNGVSWNVLARVSTFNVVPEVRHVSEDGTSPGIEDVLPSALLDQTGSLLNTHVEQFGNSNTDNFGQYLLPTFTSDVIGWRPTSVTFIAQVNKTPGTFRVQMREASASSLPRTTVLEEKVINSSTLPLLMLPQSYSFTTLPREAPGNPMCLTLMYDSGSGPAKIQTNRAGAGFLKTSGGTAAWSYDASNTLSVVLYGVPMRMGARASTSTQYLLNVGLALAQTANAPLMQTTALMLNHPEILTGLWELKFDRDPTLVDVNGDGAGDWTVSSGGSVTPGQLSGGAWTTSSDTLTTSPASDFPGVVIADARMQATGTGAIANFTVNGAWSGGASVGINAALHLRADGTQTLTISQAAGPSTWTTLIVFSQLRAQPTDVRLVLDPAQMGVGVNINGVHKGTFPVTRVTVAGATHGASLSASGGTVKFSYARVRVLRVMP